jgi:CRISPR-associated protein Cas6
VYWQDDEDAVEGFRVPDDVVDVVFKMSGSRLVVDHAQSLAHAICEKLPDISHRQIGIHRIRVGSSGNGWNSPAEAEAIMQLSRRTRLVMRIHKDVYQQVLQLCDSELEIEGEQLKLGTSSVRKLSSITTLFCHGIVSDQAQAESDFLDDMASALEVMNIKVKKMICGTTQSIRSDQGSIFTRALMVAGLTPEESVELQQCGIGTGRLIGCGLFLPHRGIDAVFSAQE